MKCGILILFLAATASWSIAPPAILQIQAGIDSSAIPNFPYAKITFRNNSVETTRFFLFRRDSTEAAYTFVAVIPVGAASFTSETPKYAMKYYYLMRAVSASDTSQESNLDSVVTPAKKEYFKSPSMNEPVWDSVSKTILISYFDSSNCEDGYRIWRKNVKTGDSIPIDMPAKIPDLKEKVTWIDSAVEENICYLYRIECYKDSLFLSSTDKMVFLVNINTIFRSLIDKSKPVYGLGKKLSVIPVNYNYGPYWTLASPYSFPIGWALKYGDSIFIKEVDSIAYTYSVIDVSDANNLRFAGTNKTEFPSHRIFAQSRAHGSTFCVYSLMGGEYYHLINSGVRFQKIDDIPVNFNGLPEFHFFNDSIMLCLDNCDIRRVDFNENKASITTVGTNQCGKNDFLGILNNTAFFMHKEDVTFTNFEYVYYILCLNPLSKQMGVSYLSFIGSQPPTDSSLYPPFREIDGYYIKIDNFNSYEQVFLDTTKKVIFLLTRNDISAYELTPFVAGVRINTENKKALIPSFSIFHAASGISLQLPNEYNPAAAKILIYSLHGKQLFSLPIDKSGRAVWNTSRQARGAYLLSIEKENRVASTKLVIVR